MVLVSNKPVHPNTKKEKLWFKDYPNRLLKKKKDDPNCQALLK